MGYVYISSNPNFKDEYKIGASKTPLKRMKQLHTSTPRPFDIRILLKTEEYLEVEKQLHVQYNLQRVEVRHEFFKLDLTDLREIIRDYSQYIVKCNFQNLNEPPSKPQPRKNFWNVLQQIFEDKHRSKLPERYILQQLKREGISDVDARMELKMLDEDGKIVYDTFESTWGIPTDGIIESSMQEINEMVGMKLYPVGRSRR